MKRGQFSALTSWRPRPDKTCQMRVNRGPCRRDVPSSPRTYEANLMSGDARMLGTLPTQFQLKSAQDPYGHFCPLVTNDLLRAHSGGITKAHIAGTPAAGGGVQRRVAAPVTVDFRAPRGIAAGLAE